ncbi:MAG UNVERIFIED_CONTAM: hypothetical protein MIO30_22090 [Methylobacterium ajmalii]|jgi:hypothetical protein
MDPTTYAFEVRRGASDILGVELATQDVVTQRVRLKRLENGAYARWSLAVPGQAVERTTQQDGGLVYDPDLASVYFPMTAAFISALPADAPMRTIITVVEADGTVSIWLDGTVTARG